MSRYAWEHGTIKLPTGEPARLRKAMQRAADAHIAAVNAEVERAWKHLRALPAAKRRMTSYYGDDAVLRDLSEHVLHLLQHHEHRDGKSITLWRKPTQKAIRESAIVRHKDHAGTAHTVFRCGWDATITLAGNRVTWDVPENNHAPEHAHAHPLAAALFGHLHTVRWTSRSGGTIVGNDEYTRDNRDAGGGGNYTVMEFSAKTAAAVRNRYTPRGW